MTAPPQCAPKQGRHESGPATSSASKQATDQVPDWRLAPCGEEDPACIASDRAHGSLVEHALHDLALGWSVFPLHSVNEAGCSCGNPKCPSPGKHPHLPWEEFQTRRPTEAEVLAWWDQWPDANIGVATGRVSGLVVLDIDGQEGLDNLRRLGLKVPKTVIAKTGGGGWHLYYHHPGEDCPNTKGKICPKVDTRGDGGYVVAPPSMHMSGNEYSWIIPPDDLDVQDSPGWLLEIHRVGDTRTKAPALPPRVAEGTRNATLASLAGSMRRRGASEASIMAALQVENDDRCDPPLPLEQLQAIAKSVARYEQGGLSAQDDRTQRVVVGQRALPFRQASELRSIASEKPQWLVEGMVAGSCISMLSGKVKAGKTSLCLGLCAAVVSGTPFLGYPVTQSGLVYLTEERAPTFRASLERVGLLDADSVYLLLHHEADGAPWAETVASATSFARDRGAGLLVVDTISDWAAVSDENDSAQALAAVRPLHAAAAAGLAVLVLAHARKSGGQPGDDARGSSAYGGAVDILISLRRMNQAGHETRRELEVVGRFDGGPGRVVIERGSDGYRLVGDPGELERSQVREALLATLPHEEEAAVTFATMRDALGSSKTTLERALDALVEPLRL